MEFYPSLYESGSNKQPQTAKEKLVQELSKRLISRKKKTSLYGNHFPLYRH